MGKMFFKISKLLNMFYWVTAFRNSDWALRDSMCAIKVSAFFEESDKIYNREKEKKIHKILF